VKKLYKGLKKEYFNLKIITLYSTLYKIFQDFINYQYHLIEFKFELNNKDPPTKFGYRL